MAAGLQRCQDYFRRIQPSSPQVLGSETFLSVMTDWNPAEIIGTKPKPLAFSLYRHVVTDETWATQRAEYGYRDIRPHDLLVDLLGHPYIDVRACFNSFIPATLDETTTSKLMEYYLKQLRQQPELHDKVEFDILFTCATFDSRDEIERAAAEADLSPEEIQALDSALTAITETAIRRTPPDLAAIAEIEADFVRIMDSELDPLERIYQLINKTRARGALVVQPPRTQRLYCCLSAQVAGTHRDPHNDRRFLPNALHPHGDLRLQP